MKHSLWIKSLVALPLTALLAYVAGLWLPWWSVAIAAALVAFAIRQHPVVAFLVAFVGVGGLWYLMANGISEANEHLLAHKISQIILKKDQSSMLIGISAAIGGAVAAFGALTGSLIRPYRKN